jgi:hypothetical protein
LFLPQRTTDCVSTFLNAWPSSRPNIIPTVIHLLRQLKPAFILYVGIGFGKWGYLFREYTDILEAERDPARYERKNWRVRIDGIEGHAAYVTELHRYLYNNIHLGDARELLPKLPSYDLIFLGDIIEHFDKKAGMELLRVALTKAGKAVIVSTPKFETGQPDLCGNELERHRSLWAARDFRKFDGAMVKTVDRDTLLAVLREPGVPALVCKPPMQPKPADSRRLREAREELVRLIPIDTPFILVDDEQLRSELSHRRAHPFLERDGQYWGPPADDETAIRECERLRQSGARFLAFAWPSFWWLEHYSGFAKNLRTQFRCVQEDERVVVFDLQA